MQHRADKGKLFWYAGFCNTLLVLIAGIVFIIPYFVPLDATSPFLTVLRPSFATALSFILIACAFLSLLCHIRYLANGLGFIVLSISCLRMLEVFKGQPRETSLTFLSHYTQPIASLPMTEVASFAFMLIGLSLVFWPIASRNAAKGLVSFFVSQLVLATAFVGLLSHFFHPSFIGISFLPLNPYVGLGFIAVGLAFAATSRYEDSLHQIEIKQWLPLVLTPLLIGLTVILCISIIHNRSQAIKTILQTKASDEADDLNRAFSEHLHSLTRMSRRIEFSKSPPSAPWEADAEDFLREFPAFTKMIWLDAENFVRNVVPRENNSKLVDAPFTLNENMQKGLDEAIENKKPYAGLLFNQESMCYFYLFFPAFWEGTFQGTLLAILHSGDFFKAHLSDEASTFFIAVTYHNQTLLYSNSDDQDWLNKKHWQFSQEVLLGNQPFTLWMYPRSTLLEAMLGNTQIYIIMIGGLIIALAFGALLILWELTQNQLLSLEKLQDELSLTQQNMTTSLAAAGIGTWGWDSATGHIHIDNQTEKLLGFSPEQFSGSYKDILPLVHSQDVEAFMQKVTSFLQSKKNEPLKIKGRLVWPDGTVHFLMLQGQKFEEGGSEKIFGSIWDMTRAEQAYQRLSISQNVIRILSEASSVKEAATQIIDHLLQELGFEVSVIWLWNEKLHKLECMDITYASLVESEAFIEANQKFLGKDTTISQLVMTGYRPVIVEDLQDTHPQIHTNLRGAIAFPMYQGMRFAGVVENYKREPYHEVIGKGFEDLVLTIGSAIGQFIQRIEAKKELELLGSIVTYSGSGQFLVDRDGFIKSWNASAQRIFGYAADEIIGQRATIFFTRANIPLFDELRDIVLSGKAVEHLEIEAIHKNGKHIWVSGSIAPIHDEKGKVTNGSIVVEDITEQQEKNAALKKSEEKFRLVIETVEEWIWEINTQRLITYSSPAVSKILGYAAEEVLHTDVLFFLFENERAAIAEEFQLHVEKKQGWTKRLLRWRHKDGSERWLEGNSKPLFDENGTLVGFRGAHRDVTESLVIDKAKTEFISVVSHELRTPLTSIHGALGLVIEKMPISDEAKQLLKIAYRNSTRLTKLINDLLDIQKIQLEKFTIPLVPVSLRDVIEESVQSARPLADKEHKEILCPPMPQIIVNADYGRLIQVMGNLLSNAIKFSPAHSRITVSTVIKDHTVKVSVQDEGKGIPKEFQDKVFEKFARAETGDARNAPGTGLGLNISKTIIEKCGGQIGFVTEEGKGSTFYFELPLVS